MGAQSKPTAEDPRDWQAAAASLCAHLESPLATAVRKAADHFYEGLLSDVQSYLRENADFNLSSELEGARRREREAREALNRVAEALGSQRSGWPSGLPVERVADEAIAAVERLKAGRFEVNAGELLDFRNGLTSRADWLKSEYLKGGDFNHLSAREAECLYVATRLTERFRIASPEAAS